MSEHPRCMIVLMGESFRLGGQGNRNIGSEESFQGQMEAADSHLAFMRDVKRKFEISSDILLNTYRTRFDAELLNKYSKNDLEGTIHPNFNPSQIGLQGIFDQSCEMISGELAGAEFVQFIRVDLILKRSFSDLFYPETEKILWPSACFFGWHKHDGSPRVSDTMLYVPKKYFDLIRNKEIRFGHEGWSHLRSRIGSENQGLMLGTLHDSDSAKDWNTMYWMSGRHRSQIWESCNFRIDENLTVSRMDRGRWVVCDKLV